jgi:hypothetical protein
LADSQEKPYKLRLYPNPDVLTSLIPELKSSLAKFKCLRTEKMIFFSPQRLIQVRFSYRGIEKH